MSEENDHGSGFPFHVFQMGPSAEQLDRHNMAIQEAGHETVTLLESMTAEQLSAISGILRIAINTKGKSANYHYGLVESIIHYKHNICMVCGVDHDKALSDMAGAPEVEIHDEPTGSYCSSCAALLNTLHSNDCVYLKKYNVETDDDGSIKVMCKNCGMWYNSLEDRMLKPETKNGCSGCVLKEKWG